MIENMFHVPFIHLKVNDWNRKKEKLLHLYSISLKKIELTDDQIYTNYHQDCDSLIQDIENIFKDEIQEFCSSFSCNATVTCAWFELSRKNSYHCVHNHGALGYSSVCFISYNEKCHTPTQFVSPFLNFLNGAQINYIPSNIKEGSIILFPSAIYHYTDPNTSDEERLIVSFNLDVK